MGYWKGAKKRMLDDSVVNKETVKDVEALPFRANEERGISQETCERFGVRCAVSTSDGVTPEAYYFPSYNKKGKIVGYMKQDVTKDKEEPRHWTAVGSVSISNKLFGQNVAESIERRKKNIIITEGQWDCLSVYQAATDNVKGTKWADLEPFVVSIPLGTANAAESVLQNFQYISSFDEVTVFFDNDEATQVESRKGILKGREASEAVFSTLVGEGIGLFQLEAVEPHKDSSDYVQAGEWRELAKLISFGREPYKPEKIVKVGDIDFEELIAPPPEGVIVPQFPELMKKTSGFHKRALTLVTAPSGCVDKDTEFLTPEGWKKISEYEEGDMVSQYTESGNLEFVYPQNYIKLPCNGFYHLESHGGLDQMLSEEHTVVYFNPKKGKEGNPLKISMADLMYRHNKNKFGFQGKVKTVFQYDGKGLEISEGYLRLQVAVMADGSVVKEGKNNYTQMRFYKKRKYDRLIDLCRKHNIPFKDNGMKESSKSSTGEEFEVIVWPKFPDKKFDSKYYLCSSEQLGIICDEVMYWDGTFSTGGKSSNRYFSQYKSDVDFIQFAFASQGVRCSVGVDSREGRNDNYWLSVNSGRKFVGLPSGTLSGKKVDIKMKPSLDGFKYCFTVDSSMLVLRRNGKIFITGNSGKTTAVSIISNEIEKANQKLGMIYLEEQTKETVQRLIAEKLKVNYLKFKREPLRYASRERLKEIYEELSQNEDVLLLDHFGSLPIQELMDRVKYLHLVEGCDYIILDHLSMVISGNETTDERKELDIVMTELAAFCAANDVGIIVVCHLNRQGTADQFKGPKTKEGEEEKPYWIRVTKESLRGSAALEQLSFVILGLEPEILPNRERGRVRWTILKNRPTGYLGEADIWRLSESTWEVELFDNED